MEDVAEVDVTQAFQQEGVDIDGMILLSNGNWDEDVYLVSKSDGLEEWLTEAELQERWKNCLGQFKDEVETLAGEISFTAADGADGKHCMKLHAPVFLANKNRLGIRDPLPADRIIERLNPENADLRSLPRPITKLTFGASCANGYSDIPPATVRTEWD